MPPAEIKTETVSKAVNALQRRAERENQPTKLREIYVESGVLHELDINTNQMIHGRRGVGKTHLLSFYRDWCAENHENILFQTHDCQRLTSGLASSSSSDKTIAANAFSHLLNDISTAAFDDLPRLMASDSTVSGSNSGEAILAFQDVISDGGENGALFNFRNLGDTLDRYRENASAPRLIIALDEFVSLPKQAQPYFAEYIKRSFFTKPSITFVIASVTYSSRTWIQLDNRGIGFEPGADTFGDVDLDQHFIWEEDNLRAELFFSQVLYNHLAEDLGFDLVCTPDEKKSHIIQYFFTQDRAFFELCRAAEGNCRDLLNVFRQAYFKFYRDDTSSRISVQHVSQGAEDWYRSEKLRAVQGTNNLEDFMNFLIGSVIRERKTKTFMVHYKDVNHPILTQLYAARLLHPLRTVWKHPDQPGEPYHLVTIDYGCYVALRNTKSAPDEQLFYDINDSTYEDIVPLDDRRSIRRVILTRANLEKFAT